MGTPRVFAVLGALSALIGVAAGAFGAHALRSRLDPEMLAVFETGARYQMYHALALLACGWAADRFRHRAVDAAGLCFAAGTLLFSGSLYALALSGTKAWGAITPIGGALFLAGWLSLAWGAARGAAAETRST
ncbi:MAG: DUF423 domain-containing protein [Planctomycetes bacterium]|nr:DUF423 domain-containing protein [Planctomycetota bacterium]